MRPLRYFVAPRYTATVIRHVASIVRQMDWVLHTLRGNSSATLLSYISCVIFYTSIMSPRNRLYRACKLLKFVSMVSMFLTISGDKQKNCGAKVGPAGARARAVGSTTAKGREGYVPECPVKNYSAPIVPR